tara:strand:+ start:4959 stop:5426 length:468 start_codon:yes stop_codon:yes gene_type:complete
MVDTVDAEGVELCIEDASTNEGTLGTVETLAEEVDRIQSEEEDSNYDSNVQNDGKWNISNLKNNKNPSILDNLAENLQNTPIVNVDKSKANASLQFLRKNWKNWIFGRVIRVQGMGPPHIVRLSELHAVESYFFLDGQFLFSMASLQLHFLNTIC